ncbi:RNA helicase [Friedmanniomyces endolithicus]|uniref:RNA helicase n=1 Tax=Friedmanniomyces endolithicus TaxID=329885 RepID=A0AAN6J5X7_9PEZI|nr:RNA helicase [Friedmanniomyces endolithicus]KAK0290051.1 RNA helicase [Friedmanniomyces endolithicus]KAK0318447.1 RNA helicase [Friedmanniomyces endolithicus]KAK1017200.1 RNA helicase [Friedmanniomyces endolithicus]
MLPVRRPVSRCIYCAFRTQQRVLQARRLRSTASTASNANNGPHIRSFPSADTNRREAERPYTLFPTSSRGRAQSFPHRSSDKGRRDGPRITWQSGRSGADNLPTFNETLNKRMEVLKEELESAPFMEQLRRDAEKAGEQKDASFKRLWNKFSKSLVDREGPRSSWGLPAEEDDGTGLRKELQDAHRTRGVYGLDERIKYAFYGQVVGSRFTESDIRNQKVIADLRYPAEWFPATRALQRTVHLHVGPTNSGKTYQALQRLENAATGAYAGPLRLLAHEVYTRLNAKGRPCILLTGEERRRPTIPSPFGAADLKACTVEMMPLNRLMDVAVIDEIQMIGNKERGWAWTQALMGVRAKEVHLCGEARTIPLVRELCASVGDTLEIHEYKRLSPLKLADRSMNGDLKELKKGDCIVSFSIMGIHALRKQIEIQTGRKVATVYGSLPPETRAQQARLFNDPDNDYDFLVASDAVGMGLNLAIKRIIFETSSKFDGQQRRTLSVADIKQIAGRAGRYRTAQFNANATPQSQDLAAAKGDSPITTTANAKEPENVGLVTTLEQFDFPVVSAAMTTEPEPIRTAGLFPPSSVLERFAGYFPPGTPLSYILIRLHELSQMHGRFHLCGLKEQIWIADIIEPVTGLTISDRNIIISAPASKSDDMWKTLMPAYARCIAQQSGGNILDIPELPLETLEAEVSASRDYLRALERLHKGIVTYLWLSYRFAGIFSTRGLAVHIKTMVEERIEEVLGKFSFSETERRRKAERREKEVLAGLKREAAEAAAIEIEVGKEEDGQSQLRMEEDEIASEDLADEMVQPLESGESSLIAGGDHFAGEEDIALEDPAVSELVEVEDGPQAGTPSFAEWRAQQTRGESQVSHEKDNTDPDMTRPTADHARGEDVITASKPGQVERPSDALSSSAAVDAEVAEAGSSSENAGLKEALLTPETRASEIPVDSQVESLEAVELHNVPEEMESVSTTAGQYSQQRNIASRMQPEHLAAYEDAKGSEQGDRRAESMP